MCKFKPFGGGPFLSFRGGGGPEPPRHGPALDSWPTLIASTVGEAAFVFSAKIGLKSVKIRVCCILFRPVGGLELPRLRYCWCPWPWPRRSSPWFCPRKCSFLGLGQLLFDLFDLLNLGQGYDFFLRLKFHEKFTIFCTKTFFFWRTLARCVVGSWPPAFLSLASSGLVLGKSVLGLGLGFFCVLSLGPKSCVLDSISSKGLQTSNLCSDLPNLATKHKTFPKSNRNPTSEKGAEIWWALQCLRTRV